MIRRNLTPIVWTYLASLLSALPLALAGGFIVDARYGRSLMATQFATGVDPELAMEFLTSSGNALALFGPLVLGALVFFTALSAFLSGAVIASVSSAEPPRTSEFFSGGGRVLGRLLRLVLFGVPFGLLATGLIGFGSFKAVGWLTEDWVSEKGIVAMQAAALFVTLAVLAWSNGAYDLMKVESVARGEHRARYAFVRGVVRAARHPLDLLRVYLPYAGAAVVLTIVVSLIDVRMGRSGWFWVLLGLALQQATAFLRAALSVGLASAEVAWVRAGR